MPTLPRCFAFVLCLFAGKVVLPAAAGSESPAPRPNVILILVDDLGAGELSVYGHPYHRTPNLDRLALEGVYFSTAYTPPVCHPARAALLTGQYPHHSGVFHFANRAGGPPVYHQGVDDITSRVTLGQLFQQAGYATALAGKWQMSGKVPDLIHEAGFDHYRIWAYDENLPAGITHTGGREPPPISRTSRYWHPCILEDGAYKPTRPDDYGPDLFTDFLIDFIEQSATSADPRPFFAYYPMVLSHEPYYPTPDSWQPGQDKFTHDPANWSAYVAYTDRLVGRLVDTVERLQLSDNTVIIFMGDNGTHKAGKGMTTEAGARVPLIIKGPGLDAHRGRAEALTDITDLYPTLIDLAGLSPAEAQVIDGVSLAPYLRGVAPAPRQWIYGWLGGRRVLRTERWLLENNTPWNFGQLYDCGDSRDGTGYQDVTASTEPDVLAARQEIRAILSGLPVPEISRDHPKLWPREQPFHLLPDKRTTLNSPAIIKLWPEGVPGQWQAPPAMQTDGRRYWSIHDPELTVFPARDPTPGAPLMLVVPGGGYSRNGWLNGGLRIARWLNGIGVTAAVLKYRLHEYNHPAQLQDAQRALRILRQRAGQFGGSPDNIGVIGSSAGGHLAAHLAVAWDLDTGLEHDALQSVSARPDFQILLYPVVTAHAPHAHAGSRRNVLGENPTPEDLSAFSIEELARPDVPPAFIVTTSEDAVVPVENSLLLYQALHEAGIPVDLHVFQEGPHGFSAQSLDLPVSGWTTLAEQWMRHLGLLPAPTGTP